LTLTAFLTMPMVVDLRQACTAAWSAELVPRPPTTATNTTTTPVSTTRTTTSSPLDRDGHPPVLYGHLHMAKTGGTSLNGDLACGFERVCGHKGYSYDAYQLEVRKAAGFSPYANYGRPHSGNYKHAEEDKIGYEDCDFISKEVNWAFWKQFQNWSIPLQLHVPCRKPIDLLMSMCNFRKFRFNCSRPAVAQVDYCSLVVGPSDGGDSQYWFDRWNRALRNATNTFVKCYRFEDQFTRYVPHMRSLLQKKRFPADFKFVKMNRKRKDECIYAPENAGLRASVVKYLLERWDYNQFCYECIGSEDDLFAK